MLVIPPSQRLKKKIQYFSRVVLTELPTNTASDIQFCGFHRLSSRHPIVLCIFSVFLSLSRIPYLSFFPMPIPLLYLATTYISFSICTKPNQGKKVTFCPEYLHISLFCLQHAFRLFTHSVGLSRSLTLVFA